MPLLAWCSSTAASAAPQPPAPAGLLPAALSARPVLPAHAACLAHTQNRVWHHARQEALQLLRLCLQLFSFPQGAGTSPSLQNAFVFKKATAACDSVFSDITGDDHHVLQRPSFPAMWGSVPAPRSRVHAFASTRCRSPHHAGHGARLAASPAASKAPPPPLLVALCTHAGVTDSCWTRLGTAHGTQKTDCW